MSIRGMVNVGVVGHDGKLDLIFNNAIHALLPGYPCDLSVTQKTHRHYRTGQPAYFGRHRSLFDDTTLRPDRCNLSDRRPEKSEASTLIRA
ncbi:hypothetical protein EVAR_7308_1 [Eumeta japonica]|uniref:Uncharacterized protein n=1 Tax=Eumeta variegata TaxID=151549 RepID=A0A4C1T634_EUMVA|nr:hypothetical protein EVAR_7308_1 [Eumeta japonica]